MTLRNPDAVDYDSEQNLKDIEESKNLVNDCKKDMKGSIVVSSTVLIIIVLLIVLVLVIIILA